MTVFRLILSPAVVLAVLASAGGAAGQPSAPDPEDPTAAPPVAAPQDRDAPGAGPGSPDEEAARRQARLDDLFARLADAGATEWQPVQSEIWRMWSRSGSPSMDLLLRRADEAVGEGDPELALRFLDDLVRLAPDFAEGWNKRATVYFMLGEYGRSVADIERTLALEPRHFGALSGLAMILERLGDKPGAYVAYAQALEVHPNLPGAAKAVERLAPEVEGREL
ncbi:MAG TPA: tetratricopeptide repeat protein [Thermohalobaculum sp.]|nr:tetratricopeptide repeat protein [Thermohalobaculum sp.]